VAARTIHFESTHTTTMTRRPQQPPRRHISAKLQEIALRSPKDLAAFDALADLVLARLNGFTTAINH